MLPGNLNLNVTKYTVVVGVHYTQLCEAMVELCTSVMCKRFDTVGDIASVQELNRGQLHAGKAC